MTDTLITPLKTLIKITSILLMSGAIALGGMALYATATDQPLPAIPSPILALGGFAVIAHLLEAIVAANLAPSRRQSAILYGLYTFFVGTVGLQELWMIEPEQTDEK